MKGDYKHAILGARSRSINSCWVYASGTVATMIDEIAKSSEGMTKEREEALMTESPSLSGPSLPEAFESVTPASMSSSRILLCMSVPSEPPF